MNDIENRLQGAIDVVNHRIDHLIRLDHPSRDDFLKFQSSVVTKPELEQVNQELERIRGIIEVLEAEISDDEEEETSMYKDHEYSDESISIEQLDKVGEIEQHSSTLSVEMAMRSDSAPNLTKGKNEK